MVGFSGTLDTGQVKDNTMKDKLMGGKNCEWVQR